MAKMDYSKAARAQHFADSVRLARQADAALLGADRPGAPKASPKQIDYIQRLLVAAGRRRLVPEEYRTMTVHGASRLIEQLKAAAN